MIKKVLLTVKGLFTENYQRNLDQKGSFTEKYRRNLDQKGFFKRQRLLYRSKVLLQKNMEEILIKKVLFCQRHIWFFSLVLFIFHKKLFALGDQRWDLVLSNSAEKLLKLSILLSWEATQLLLQMYCKTTQLLSA